VILLISIVLGLLPLAGIVSMFLAGSLFTVDGLFESLILLSLSGVFFLNVLFELHDRHLLPFGAAAKVQPKPPSSSEGS
jgi:hypothetical protein